MPAITLSVWLAFTCLLPAAAGVIKYKRMNSAFHPFIWAMLLSVLTESIVTLRYLNRWPVPIHYLTGNLYFLLNVFFYLLFFYRLKVISFTWLKILMAACGLVFIISAFIKNILEGLTLGSGAFYIIIIFSITGKLMSEQVLNTKIPLQKNALFLIGCGVLLTVFYFLYSSLRFFKISHIFILSVMQYANALSYLVFFWGVLCIPRKVTFQ